MDRKRILSLALALAAIAGCLSGCGGRTAPEVSTTAPVEQTEPTIPATVPADGNPADVTCKGSYTGQTRGAVVATVGGRELTDQVLAAWYWAQVAAFRQAEQPVAPDFDRPLDTQTCPLDGSVNSWQQYFLKQALAAWHTAQALALQGENLSLPVEEAYDPDLEAHEENLTGKPATRYLYRYSTRYQPNTMHQDYLDGLPQTLADLAGELGYGDAGQMAQEAFGTDTAAVEEFAWDYNYGYMYFTSLSDYIEITDQEVEDYYQAHADAYAQAGITRSSGQRVDIRQILLLPKKTDGTQATVDADGRVSCTQAEWDACRVRAEQLLDQWRRGKATDASFGELAYKNSDDSGTAASGGSYRGLRQGQLTQELDAWCFQEGRQAGDAAVFTTEYGCYILYFSGSTQDWYAQAEEDLRREKQAALLSEARRAYPIQVDYSAIALPLAQGTVSTGDVLYPDVAHQRFPEVPLYLQQDYGDTKYGGHPLSANGCGICCLAMAASYLTDQEWTPPQLCALYGRYGGAAGTDGMIYFNEPPAMGFYLKEKIHDPQKALEYLQTGYIIISVQYKGYWTTGGHYILLEKCNPDGTIQVRDSNLENYGRLEGHSLDAHSWRSITTSVDGFWVFERKVTTTPACERCGDPQTAPQGLLAQPYQCEKCRAALLRREVYLTKSAT